MLFFVIFYSVLASYTLFFPISKYIKKIRAGENLNCKLLLNSLIEVKPSETIHYKQLFFFFIFFLIALLALESTNPWQIENKNISLTICFIWILFLTSLAKVDHETGFLPNSLTYPFWITGCLIQLFNTESAWYLYIIPSLTFLLIGKTIHDFYFKSQGKSPFGMGDIKLLSALLIWTGLSFIVTIIFLACGLLLIYHKVNKKKSPSYPFGPFLLLGVLGTHILYALS